MTIETSHWDWYSKEEINRIKWKKCRKKKKRKKREESRKSTIVLKLKNVYDGPKVSFVT